MAQLVDQFLRAKTSQQLSPATVIYYRRGLRVFVAQFGTLPIAELNRVVMLEAFHAANIKPNGQPAQPDTVRRNAIALEQLGRWARNHGLLKKRQTVLKFDKPTGQQRQRIPTAAETAKLLEAAPPEFVRIYQALRHSGKRPNELCRATIADCDFQRRIITLAKHKTAKRTGRPLIVPIGKKLGQLMREAIGDRTAGPVFLDPAGREWTVTRLSSRYRYLRNKAELPRDLCLYLARHEHGTKVCKARGIHAAKEALGHSSINMTQRYAHPDAETLRDNQDAFDE